MILLTVDRIYSIVQRERDSFLTRPMATLQMIVNTFNTRRALIILSFVLEKKEVKKMKTSDLKNTFSWVLTKNGFTNCFCLCLSREVIFLRWNTN